MKDDYGNIIPETLLAMIEDDYCSQCNDECLTAINECDSFDEYIYGLLESIEGKFLTDTNIYSYLCAWLKMEPVRGGMGGYSWQNELVHEVGKYRYTINAAFHGEEKSTLIRMFGLKERTKK